jgi:hypothetical protein
MFPGKFCGAYAPLLSMFANGMNKHENLSRTRPCFKRIFNGKIGWLPMRSGVRQGFGRYKYRLTN